MKKPIIPNHVRCEKELTFRFDIDPPLNLTLYWHPASKTPTPAVLWFFGGGWLHGDRSFCQAALHLLKHGFALVCPDYRMSYQATFPSQVEDAKAATRWARGMAQTFNIDGTRMGAWGESAGGYLATMTGVASHIKKWDEQGPFRELPSAVQAVCDWSGPTNFYRMNEPPCTFDHDAPDSYESRLMGAPIREIPQKVASANPITYIDKNTPPFLIMHGMDDKTIIPNQSRLLHDALIKKGVDSKLIFLPGYGHKLGATAGTEAIDPVIRFFKQKLHKNKAAD